MGNVSLQRTGLLSVWFLGLLFSLVLLIAPAGAQTVSVNGMVKDRDGYPKSNVGVQVNGYVTSTDARGNFSVVNVRPGHYRVTVREKSNVQRFNVNIQAGAPIDLTVGW